jgi:hypothetical protein
MSQVPLREVTLHLACGCEITYRTRKKTSTLKNKKHICVNHGDQPVTRIS